MAIGGFVIKTGVVVGAVYYTQQLGVWGNSQQSEQIYNDVKTTIRPHVKELEKKLPFEIPAIPPKGEIRYLLKHYYNEGVKSTFNFISMVPCYAGQLMAKARDTVADLMQMEQQQKQPSKDIKCRPESK